VGGVTVSVLLATMGRLEKAQACVQSIKDTTKDVEIVVALDGPGAVTLADMGCVVDHATEPRGCSRAWNDALALSTGDPVVLAADDLEFRHGWLDAALKKLEFEVRAGSTEVFYGHIVEHGSTHTAPHPFLIPALEASRAAVVADVHAALKRII
jgi:glycosyltransferase involved in cell wall biosynthesis